MRDCRAPSLAGKRGDDPETRVRDERRDEHIHRPVDMLQEHRDPDGHRADQKNRPERFPLRGQEKEKER